jgi:uncharacterized Zn finger protein (UPF0148 family)
MVNAKIQCPLCGHGFYFGSAEKHRQKAHPEIEFAKFLADIEQAKRLGKLKFRRQKQPKSKVNQSGMRTATTVLQEEKKTNKGIRSVVSAGAFGMGKMR